MRGFVCMMQTMQDVYKRQVDYYSFSYPQKSFYSKMGISSEIPISLESTNSQAYNLVLYDLYGNQIGIATDDGHGNKQLTVTNWDCVTSDYVIRVETVSYTHLDVYKRQMDVWAL